MSKLVAVSASAALLGVLAFGTPADAGQRDRSDIRNIEKYEVSSQRQVRRERVAQRRAMRRDRIAHRRAVRRDRIADRRRITRRDRVAVGVHAGPGPYYPFLGYRAATYPGYRPYYAWDYPLYTATSLAFLPFAAMGGALDPNYAQAPAREPVVRAMY